MNYYISAIIIFALYHYLNIQLGRWNVSIVKKRKAAGKKNQIEHGWWFLGYLIICAPQYWLINLWFALSLIPLHLSIFAVAYNHFIGLLPFNLSKTSDAITDRMLVRMGFNDMEWPCIIAESVSLILFIVSLILL